MSIVTLGYLGWMGYLLMYSLRHYTRFGAHIASRRRSSSSSTSGGTLTLMINALTVLLFSTVSAYLRAQSSPPLYHLYTAFPFFFFNRIAVNGDIVLRFLRRYLSVDILLHGVYFVCALELLVVGYFRREMYSVCFIALGIGPALLGVATDFKPRVFWIAACIYMSFFTLLPADFGSDISLVCLGGVLTMLVQFWMMKQDNSRNARQMALFFVQFALIALVTVLVYSTEQSLACREGLPELNKALAWGASCVSLLLPLLSDGSYKIRIQSVTMAYAVPFIMLSVSYEVLFFTGLNIVLYMWLQREYRVRHASGGVSSTSNGTLHREDFTTALFFIFFICVAFFGTGNLATIASFEISSVYRFITVFSPFAMTGLLLFKLMVPLLMVVCSFAVLMKVTNTPSFGAFFLVLALSDVMTINFFFLVTDYGSWLEIGNGISRFAIGNGMIILVLLLFALSQIYKQGVYGHDSTVARESSRRRKSSRDHHKLSTTAVPSPLQLSKKQ